MLRKRFYVGESGVEGLGLFAGEDIREGEVVWELDGGFDIEVGEGDVYGGGLLGEFLRRYCFRHGGRYYLCGDGARYTNHSDDPNVGGVGDGMVLVALRGICVGEEVFEDYGSMGVDGGDMKFNIAGLG